MKGRFFKLGFNTKVRHRFYVWLTGFLLLSHFTYGQQDTSQYRIKAISRAYKDSVIIRWAPSSPSAWEQLIEYGYKVERHTIMRDGKVLKEKPMVLLSALVKPAHQREWEIWMERDDFVAVSAQAIFGETFQIDSRSTDVMQIYQKVQEQESRYSFCLFAADLSRKAAELSGLLLIDRTVKENEMYLYQITSLVPENFMKIIGGYTYSGPAEAKPLPAPFAPEVEKMGESQVVLRWEVFSLKNVYNAYYLEKSGDNGQTFKKVNEVPMTVLEATADAVGYGYSSLSDTMVVGAKVLYRLIGLNSFGEEGPPSEILEFSGEAPFKYNPAITKAQVVDNSSVTLRWDFPKEGTTNVQGFEIERSKKIDEGYAVITKEPLSPESRQYVDHTPMSTNYYRVIAVSDRGIRNPSFPNMVQLEDSIPPALPKGLQAVVDSSGVVNISWQKNIEPDLLGYRVYRSAFKNTEFGQVTVGPIRDVSFVDTVNIATLTRKMYYKIAAVDTRFNTSQFSEVFELILPDITPPVPPVISGIKSMDGGVQITWVPSSSEDVIEHRILRKVDSDATWLTVKTIAKTDTMRLYLDELTDTRPYQYSMIAVDRSGLQSLMIKPLQGKSLSRSTADLEKVKATVDRKTKSVLISWKYPVDGVSKFLIYRAFGDGPMVMYKSVGAPSLQFVDEKVRMNETYKYAIKAVHRDGRESDFSQAIEIKY